MAHPVTQPTRTSRETATDQAVHRTRALLDRITEGAGPREFAVRLWNGETMPAESDAPPRFTLVLKRPSSLRRMLWPPTDLTIGEAYLNGDFDIEGDVSAAVGWGTQLLETKRSTRELLALARSLLALPSSDEGIFDGRQRADLEGELHSQQRDGAAVRYHYDVGNDFFALWQDKRMVYSCAYFPTGEETLDAAQEAKLDMICRKLRLRSGEQMLDIGCGWGGLMMWAAEHYGVEVTGVTISPSQAELARERIAAAGLAGRCRVLVEDYRNLKDTAFDKITSVGMFEHVGRPELPEYFRQCYRLLKPRGAFMNHGISGEWPDPEYTLWERLRNVRVNNFVSRYVFPDGELVRLSEALRLAQDAGFEVRDVESWREHYAQTLRHWVNRLDAHAEEARRCVGERTFRVRRLYMAGCVFGFDSRRVSVYQSLLIKPDAAGASGMLRTREDWYS